MIRFFFLWIVFKRTLEKDIAGDTSGHLKKILLGLLKGQRPESNQVNEDEAENDAKALYDAGEKRWGTDESKFVDILLNRRLIIFLLLLLLFFILLVMHN
jgi:hypothetical protein